MKTLVLETMPDLFWQLVVEHNCNNFFSTDLDLDSEIVIIRTQTKAYRDFLSLFPRLKMIIRAGSGFDNIDIVEAKKRNIIVCNTPEANTICAFEQTISFIFALIKQHKISHQNLIKGNWKTGLKPNWEMSDLKALVVGVGRVGTQVAKALQYFGSAVKGVDPYLTDSDWQLKNIDPIFFDEGLKWCNLITFHCPLTSETIDYFDANTLNSLKNPIWLINTARGAVVDISAVKTGLKNHQILGFAADVFAVEPPTEIIFRNEENVLFSPHVGSFTEKAKERLSQETWAVWKAFVLNKAIINPVQAYELR